MAQNCSSFRKLEAVAEPQTAEILREENNIFGTVEDLQLFVLNQHASKCDPKFKNFVISCGNRYGEVPYAFCLVAETTVGLNILMLAFTSRFHSQTFNTSYCHTQTSVCKQTNP